MKCKKMFMKLFELQCHHIFGIFPSFNQIFYIVFDIVLKAQTLQTTTFIYWKQDRGCRLKFCICRHVWCRCDYLTILVFYFIYILDLIPSSMEVGGLTFKCMLPSSKNLFLSSYFPIQYPRSLFSDILGILRMVFLVTMLKFWILTSNESYHSNHRYLWCILIWRCSTLWCVLPIFVMTRVTSSVVTTSWRVLPWYHQPSRHEQNNNAHTAQMSTAIECVEVHNHRHGHRAWVSEVS